MSIATLVPFEGMMNKHSLQDPSHLSGLTAVLKKRAGPSSVTTTSRRIFQFYLNDVYVTTVRKGLPSPFESLNSDFYKLKATVGSSTAMRLAAVGHELCIFLPRLILTVRAALNDDKQLVDAFMLAGSLSALRDDLAESQLLHTIRVQNALCHEGAEAVKYCYLFSEAGVFEAGAYYWHTRATLLRLLLRLRSHNASLYNKWSLPSAEQLQSELRRYVSNLIMSAPYARELKTRTRHRLLSQMMVVCWGAKRDYPDAIPRSVKETETLFAWLLANANYAHSADSPLTAKDMDAMAETFSGGPL